MVFGRFVKVETVTVGRYSRKVTPVYSVMSYVKPNPASRCSPMVRPLALDALKIAQDVVDRQDFLYRWTTT